MDQPDGDRQTDGHPHRAQSSQPSGKQPAIVTVGSGQASDNAAQLAALLRDPSGKGKQTKQYGDEENDRFESLWDSGPAVGIDESGIGSFSGAHRTGIDKAAYNRNQRRLADSISTVVELLDSLRQTNADWPAQYHPSSLEKKQAEPPVIAGQTLTRLVTPELAHDLRILKLDLKMAGLSQSEVVGSLQRETIAAILDGQIDSTVRHLHVLRERILDRTSKILVTGDLNAGKSTFCNSLLRRNVLPVDQQPCTSIFCEVLSAEMNGGVEEVHAIRPGIKYDRMDARTFAVFPLSKIEDIVTDYDRWGMCKLYLSDERSSGLLHDGKNATDIALIDAPGLNADSLQTTAVFARQEEIDVVVFVVSAANHFTQSAKEFIASAAREKAYMFMVVNGFDMIRDKGRCKNMILKQVKGLSPSTYEESDELVHFVSSKAVAPSGNPNDPDGDQNQNQDPAFDDLVDSLKQFVLEKKAQSKLAPAKTYLSNLLLDMWKLSTLNREIASQELERTKSDIGVLDPELRSSKTSAARTTEDMDQVVENETTAVYTETRSALLQTTDDLVSNASKLVPYPGIFGIAQYIDDVRYALIDEVSASVRACEEAARQRTVEGVTMIKNLGVSRLGGAFSELKFRSENMFARYKSVVTREVSLEVEIFDLVDPAILWEQGEKSAASTGLAISLAGGFGTLGSSWLLSTAFSPVFSTGLSVTRALGFENVKSLIVPGLIAAAGLAVAYVITTLPTALPHRLANRLRLHLAETDHAHSNATRIAAEVRRALKYPADNLRVGLRRGVEKLEGRRAELERMREKAERAVRGFGAVEEKAESVKLEVERVDLDGRRR